MVDRILNNPVRLYAVAAAALALVVHYVPSLPTPLILALVAAVLGVGGEAVRRQVAPMSKVQVHDDDLYPGESAYVLDDQDFENFVAYQVDNAPNRKDVDV